MSNKGHDIYLNGVGYQIDESAEGEGYRKPHSPMRPPNGSVVQGPNTQTFQIRPDILQWTISDWSGGEGQLFFDAQQPNRMWSIVGSVFERPGEFRPAWYNHETVDTGGASSFLNVPVKFIRANNTIYGFSTVAANMYEWNTSTQVWSTAQALTSAAAASGVTTDGTTVFLLGASHTYSAAVDGTTFATIGSGAGSPHDAIAVQGDYCYVGPDVSATAVREFLKSGSTPEDIAYFDFSPVHCKLVSLDGKVYAMGSELSMGTQLLEIIPSSAAGTGFGAEIARIEGFQATSMWSHSGMLFLGGHEASNQEKTTVLYLTPGGEYGTLGVSSFEQEFGEVPMGNNKTNKFLEHFFWYARGSEELTPSLFQVDAVSGGFARVGFEAAATSLASSVSPVDSVVLNNEVFICVTDASGDDRTYRFRPVYAAAQAYFITPWHDFGLTGSKILSSIDLSLNTVGSGQTVVVEAAYDGSSSWNTLTTYTAGSTGGRVAVTTGASTKEFNTVRFKVTTTGPGAQISHPIVFGMDVFVQVVRLLGKWQFVVKLDDDHSGGPGGTSGARKLTNLETLRDSGAAFVLRDGYKSRTPGVYTNHDVLMDTCEIVLIKPGEGHALVQLIEVA